MFKQVFTEPELKTNRPKWSILNSDPPDEKIYEPEGIGIMLKKGDEVCYTSRWTGPLYTYSSNSNACLLIQVAVFNMGSTVVLVFEAPISGSEGKEHPSSDFRFCIKNGDRVRMGEAIGRWVISE